MTTTAQATSALQQHAAVLRAEIAAAEAKRKRLSVAIDLKRQTLTRLEARVVLHDPVAPARPSHE